MRSFTFRFVLWAAFLIFFSIVYVKNFGPVSLKLATNASNMQNSSSNESAVNSDQSVNLTPTSNLFSGERISPIFTKEVQYWNNNIVNWSNTYGIDKNLIATVMQIESCGNPYATSGSGAMGLFQVMPFHFQANENPYDPETNAFRGMSYLRSSLSTSGGDSRLALAGYNGGIGVIGRGEMQWSAETIRYVKYGAPIYVDASSGSNSTTSLDDWYSSYGAGMCRDAASQLGIP